MKYSNAPIKEAIFEIRFDSINITKIEDLSKFKSVVLDEFPIEGKLFNHINLINFEPNVKPKSKLSNELIGFIYQNIGATRQFQVKNNSFTYNVLSPYNTWEEHFATFYKYWELFNEMFKPNSLNRIATRFINKIELPFPFDKFIDYITNIPPIPNCLPQFFAHFFLQVQVPSHDDKKQVIITETFEPVTGHVLPFILDIDVFQLKNLEDKNLIENFSEIRNIKNSVFENCITDLTREIIK